MKPDEQKKFSRAALVMMAAGVILMIAVTAISNPSPQTVASWMEIRIGENIRMLSFGPRISEEDLKKKLEILSHPDDFDGSSSSQNHHWNH